MSVSVVQEKCNQVSFNSMVVVLESEKREELTGNDARQLALTTARQSGFPAKGISSTINPYPINEKGETSEKLIIGAEPIKAWRVEYQVSAGLGL